MNEETKTHMEYLEKCLDLINNIVVGFHESGPHEEKKVVEMIMAIETLSRIEHFDF